jgi:protease I
MGHHDSPTSLEIVMSKDRLSGCNIAMLATDGFEQSELLDPKRLLEKVGAKVQVISLHGAKTIKGWSKKDWGEDVAVDNSLDKAKAESYDALILPGGVMNPDHLRLEPTAIAFIKSFGATGKPLAAICHGPWTLIDADLVSGRKVTSWPSLRKDLENAGASWEDSEVVRDGSLITSRKPADIPAFVDAVMDALKP